MAKSEAVFRRKRAPFRASPDSWPKPVAAPSQAGQTPKRKFQRLSRTPAAGYQTRLLALNGKPRRYSIEEEPMPRKCGFYVRVSTDKAVFRKVRSNRRLNACAKKFNAGLGRGPPGMRRRSMSKKGVGRGLNHPKFVEMVNDIKPGSRYHHRDRAVAGVALSHRLLELRPSSCKTTRRDSSA